MANKIAVFFLGTFLGSLLISNPAQASRVHQTMGEYIQSASLIALVDTAQKPGGRETVITFREIIRGPDDFLGKTHTIPRGNWSSGDVYLPSNLTNVAILMKDNWQKEEKPVIEIYKQPHEIVALKILARIYELPDENSRLRSLYDSFDDGNPVLQEQMLHDLRQMKEASNFHFIVELLQIADPAYQLKLVELMKRIGDDQAVQPLIETMKKPQLALEIRKSAAEALMSSFARAPGVTEALIDALDVPELREIVSVYVRKIAPENKKLSPPKLPQLTDWQKADQFLRQGNFPDAKQGFIAIVEDEKESPYTRLAAAQKILDLLPDADRSELRKPLLLLFDQKDARNYLTDRDFVNLFRKINHPDCLEALTEILMSEQSHEFVAMRTAVMAILELGSAARKKASSRLMEKIRDMATGVSSRTFYNGTHPYFLALAWIGDPESLRAAGEVLKENHLGEYWTPVIPLLGAAEQPDEGQFLIERLKESQNSEIQEWIVFRLGDLRERRAVEAIGNHLLHRKNDWYYTSKESLIKIGGPDVQRLAQELLTAPSAFVRKEAVEILAVSLPQKEFLAVIRRILNEENFGDRQSALFHIGQFGTADDLKLLEAYLDYWTSDRRLHYWATTAASSIRQRHQ